MSIPTLDELLGDDETHLERVLIDLINSNREGGSRAESLYASAYFQRPNSLAMALSRLIKSGNPDVRIQATKCLRYIFTSKAFIKLEQSTLETIKQTFLSSLRDLMGKLNYELYPAMSDLFSTGCWEELLPLLFEYMRTQMLYVQEYVLVLFGRLAERRDNFAFLFPHLNTFESTFSHSLANYSEWNLRLAALGASITFVKIYHPRHHSFANLLQLMMKTLIDAINSGLEFETKECLELLIKLAKIKSLFFWSETGKVLQLMMKIIVDDGVDDGLDVNIRHLAIKFLVQLVEKDPHYFMAKNPEFLKRLFDEIMYMLCDVEEWDEGDNHIWESSTYDLGKICLRRLSLIFLQESTCPRVVELFSYLLNSSLWKERHAGLIAITEVVLAYCEMYEHRSQQRFRYFIMEREEWFFGELLRGISPIIKDDNIFRLLELLKDPNHCVRSVAFKAIKILFVVIAPTLGKQYSERFIKELDGIMNDPLPLDSQQLVLAASALLCYLEYGTKSTIDRHKNVLVNIFRKLLQCYDEKEIPRYTDLFKNQVIGMHSSSDQPGYWWPLHIDVNEILRQAQEPPVDT